MQNLCLLGSMKCMDKEIDFSGKTKPPTIYNRVYEVVMQIPYGTVASYGQVSMLVPGSTPRLVGYAMASAPSGIELPWHRVINAKGRVSPRVSGSGAGEQRRFLEAEGVIFDEKGYIDFELFGWL